MELKITAESLEKFKPTEIMKERATNVFINIAKVEVIRPIVEEIQKRILAKYRFLDCHDKKGVILDPKYVYLIGEANFMIYHKECRAEEDKASLFVENEEFCPLLVAENELKNAENGFIDAMEELTGMTRRQISMKLDIRERYLELNLRLMAKFIEVKI